jgi:hypothetical protein
VGARRRPGRPPVAGRDHRATESAAISSERPSRHTGTIAASWSVDFGPVPPLSDSGIRHRATRGRPGKRTLVASPGASGHLFPVCGGSQLRNDAFVIAAALLVACGTGSREGSGSSAPPAPDGGSPDAGTSGNGPDAGADAGGGGLARFAVAVTATGSGRVTSTPAGIDCGTACTASFAAGTHLSLAATPSAGWHLLGWGGACSGAGACDLSVATDLIVSANFGPDQPLPNPCADIAPPADEAMRQYVLSWEDICLPGVGDGSGTLAFSAAFNQAGSRGASIEFVSSSGRFLQMHSLVAGPNLLQQPDGIAAVSGPGYYGGPPNLIALPRWDHAGNEFAAGARYGDRSHVASAANPDGGVLLAGDFSASYSGPTEHAAAMFTGGSVAFAVVWGPKPLASAGTVFGAGVDLLGRSLVVTDGAAKSGSGSISGQWFDRDGTALTGEFLLIRGFTPGPSTWFEASPLIGSGLVVRRMDSDRGLHSLAMVVVASAATTASAAPDWMVSRRDVQLQPARGRRAYATLPYGAPNVACSQRVEVLAADGTSCGARDYPIAEGTCDTQDLTLAVDGTVIQPLPLSMETELDIHGSHTCTWRWWAGAVQ